MMNELDRQSFSNILIKIKQTYPSLNEMGKCCGVTSAYLSKLSRSLYHNSPSPQILKKIADHSNGVTTYDELMVICGYTGYDFNGFLSKYYDLKDFNFNYILDDLKFSDAEKERLFSLFEHKKYSDLILGSLCDESYPKFLKALFYFFQAVSYPKEYQDIELIHSNILKTMVKNNQDTYLQSYLLHLLFLLDACHIEKNSDPLFNIPVLHQVVSDYPLLSKQSLLGYLPTDPDLYDLVHPDSHFYLKIEDNSIDKMVGKGSYLLVKKQNVASEGDTIVSFCSGKKEALLRKYKKTNDKLIVLEPLSRDLQYESIYIEDKKDLRILGKVIAYLGIASS